MVIIWPCMLKRNLLESCRKLKNIHWQGHNLWGHGRNRDKLQVPSATLPAQAWAASASAESVREEKQCRCSESHVTGILVYIETSPSPHSRTVHFQLRHVLSYNHKAPMGIPKCHPVVVNLDCQWSIAGYVYDSASRDSSTTGLGSSGWLISWRIWRHYLEMEKAQKQGLFGRSG